MVRTLLPAVCAGALAVVAGCSRDATPAAAPVVPAPAAPAPRVETVSPQAEAAAVEAAVPDDAPPEDAGTADAVRAPAFPGQVDDVTYTCEDGSRVRVTYNGTYANVTLPNGGIAPLLHSPAASAAGGIAYLGDQLALRRVGAHVQIEQMDRPTRRCSEPARTSSRREARAAHA